MKGINITLLNNQRGAATLVTSLILLLAITLVTFSAARVGVTEQRTSTNDMRAKTAQDVANAGVEYGIAYLNQNHSLMSVSTVTPAGGWGLAGSSAGAIWVACTNQTAPPCGDGNSNIYNAAGPGFTNWLYFTVPTAKMVQPSGVYSHALHYLSPCATNPCAAPRVPVDNPTVIVVAEATSADTLAGRAIALQVVRSAPSLGRMPQAPIMAAGTVQLSGTLDIWGNATGNLNIAAASQPPPGTANPVITTAASGSSATQGSISYTPMAPPGSPYTRISTMTVSAGLSTTTTVTTGTPLSVWTPAGINQQSNATTTRVPFYSNSNTVLSQSVGNNSTIGPDLLLGERVSAYLADGTICREPFPGQTLTPANPVGCPAIAQDLFSYTFGVSSSRSDEIKNQSVLIADCNTLQNLPPARYWVQGDCAIGNTTIGTALKPYVVIVEGNLSINGNNTEIYGLVYVRGNNRDVRINGGTYYGALVSESQIDQANGNIKMVYDATVLMRTSESTGTFRSLSGGWADEI